ncbi:MAG: AAA family ATPase [Candidatus Rokuibacteriota bacterium]
MHERARDLPPHLPAERLRVVAAGDITAEPGRTGWLVEGLWAAQAVGVIGGAPKSCKTWLALDLAVSVASSTAALGRFVVAESGPVLLYAAEDAPEHVQLRLQGVAAARGLDLRALQIRLILAPSLRLDTARDRARLRKTLDEERPRLLVLDPLVRLHQADENSAAEMSSLLGELRALQREYELAVLLVHHLRKNAPRAPDGQALRGSGDLHAWGDSNLYIRRRDPSLRLTIEHRSAPSPAPCCLELALEPAPHLRVLDAELTDHSENIADLGERVIAALTAAHKPLSRDALRDVLRTRNATLGDTLARLRAECRIVRADNGFALRRDSRTPIPVPAST